MLANKAFILRNIHGKYILMPIRNNNASNDPILLNEVAASIWKIAETAVEHKAVLENLSQTYGLKESSPELMAVEQFIAQMTDMGLLLRSQEEA